MKEKKSKSSKYEVADEPERRSFLVRASAMVVGGLVGLVPLASGLVVFLDPLRRKSKAAEFLKIATLDEVPPDGVPRPFRVIADRTDAWNFFPKEPVGAVYLRRTSENEMPEAVTATCPHLGCFVDFNVAQGHYHCPCHDTSFNADGTLTREGQPAARGLDSLEVEVRGENEVWVKFQKFIAGKEEKKPEA